MLKAVNYWAVDIPIAPSISLRFPEIDVSVFV
jgi:hypothetical protein